MIQLLLGMLHAFADVGRAIVDILHRRARGRYRASGTARAPIDAVWDLIKRRDIVFAASGVRMTTEEVADRPDVLLAHLVQGGTSRPLIAYRYEVEQPPLLSKVRYLRELSPAHSGVGDDDTVTISLRSDGADLTHVTYERELTHTSFATRISAPVGLRTAVAMVTHQAEHEAGIVPKRTPLWHQFVWTVLAFLSFAWLLDWRMALAVMGIIAVHELGHALFMLRYGLGLHIVSFVPFLGGVAAPKRYYESEWQRGIVALAGAGVSLPIAFAMIWAAEATHSPNLAMIAMLAVILNAINLVPFPALDGSAVVSMLLGKLHRSLNLAVTILMFGLFVAVGIVMRHPLVWAAIALSFISVVQVMSLKLDDHLIKMSNGRALVMLFLYVALIVGHGVAFQWSTITAASAEGALVAACIREAGHADSTAIKVCREKNRLWLLND